MDPIRKITTSLNQIDQYLQEKLAPGQLRWQTGNERYAVTDGKRHLVNGTRHSLELYKVPYRYWNRVILPELTRIFRIWDSKMYYDIEPDLDEFTDATMLRQINIHLFTHDHPFRIMRQRRDNRKGVKK